MAAVKSGAVNPEEVAPSKASPEEAPSAPSGDSDASATIEGTATIEPEDLVRVTHRLMNARQLAIGSLLAGLALMVTSGGLPLLQIVSVPLALAGLLGLALPWIAPWMAKRNSRARTLNLRFKISPEGLTYATPAGDKTLPWARFNWRKELPEALVLGADETFDQLHVIPRSTLSDSHYAQARQLILAKVPKRKLRLIALTRKLMIVLAVVAVLLAGMLLLIRSGIMKGRPSAADHPLAPGAARPTMTDQPAP